MLDCTAISPNHDTLSASSCLTLHDFLQALPRLQQAEEGSVQPLQLQHAASPPQLAVPSAAAAAYNLARMRLLMAVDMPAQVPVSKLDRPPDWGSPYTGSPPRHAALSPRDDAFILDRRHFLQMPANMLAQVPVCVDDRLLKGQP